jgi:hypothetical protein
MTACRPQNRARVCAFFNISDRYGLNASVLPGERLHGAEIFKLSSPDFGEQKGKYHNNIHSWG